MSAPRSLVFACALGLLFAAGATGSGARRPAHPASIWASVQRRCSDLASEQLPPYPWPIAPVHRQHPVRGYFGDPRTVVTGAGEGRYSFHNGVDISAWTGNHVLPVASGVVVKAAGDRVVVASAGRRFQYIHLRPYVSVGQHVVVSQTVLGAVDPVYHHVHLTEIRGMCVVNPLMPGHLTPYIDHTHPVVRAVVFETPGGRRLSPLALGGEVRVVADAFAPPALRSPFPWLSMPVSPVLMRWELTSLAGRTLMSGTAADFRVSLPPRHDFCRVYAPGTVQNFAAALGSFHWGKPGRYLYDLTPNLLDTALLPAGRYRFVVEAANSSGGVGTRTTLIGIRGRALTAAPDAPVDPRCASA